MVCGSALNFSPFRGAGRFGGAGQTLPWPGSSAARRFFPGVRWQRKASTDTVPEPASSNHDDAAKSSASMIGEIDATLVEATAADHDSGNRRPRATGQQL